MAEEKSLKILLIDDDKFLLDMYSLKFKKSNLDIDVSSNSQGALDKLKAGNKYDIILLDIIIWVIKQIEIIGEAVYHISEPTKIKFPNRMGANCGNETYSCSWIFWDWYQYYMASGFNGYSSIKI